MYSSTKRVHVKMHALLIPARSQKHTFSSLEYRRNSKMQCFQVSKLLFFLAQILHIFLYFQHHLVNTKKFNSMINLVFLVQAERVRLCGLQQEREEDHGSRLSLLPAQVTERNTRIEGGQEEVRGEDRRPGQVTGE
jgi:hypothetical protein